MTRRPERQERAAAADGRFCSLLASAVRELDRSTSGLAVVAHGGYGRDELTAASDLDVLLVYNEDLVDDESVARIAARLWYPMWDAGARLDHSVRTVTETRAAATKDLRTTLSLLDARHVAGDAALTLLLRTYLSSDWRRTAPRRLPELESARRERAAREEFAVLLEPDLKESYGGLRDAVGLRALAATWLVDIPYTSVARASAELVRVREALHESGGKDRLLTELQDDVAELLGLEGREALVQRVHRAARTLAHHSDVAWRQVGQILADRRSRPRSARPGPRVTPLAPGIVMSAGEVGLSREASVSEDPLLGLRAACAAASRGAMLSPYAAHRLARDPAPLPVPWPGPARRLFTDLLATGGAMPPLWEALDQVGLIEIWLPEWADVRYLPQDSAIHRHTVDRHLLRTCHEASTLVREVSRPDLLLVASLLHDIGKTGRGDHEGHVTDHAERGASITGEIAARMGFDTPDVATLVRLVRHHLLLIETATQRDLDDPGTIERTASAVGDAATLELLAALTRADARATGGAAWTAWRGRLLHTLVHRVRDRLEHLEVPRPAPLHQWQRDLAARAGVQVVPSAEQLTVAAPDRPGLLAIVAGVLTLASRGRLSVRAASVHTVGSTGVSVWWLSGELPDTAAIRERIASALAGNLDVAGRVARLEEQDAGTASGGRRRAGLPVPPPTVRVLSEVSAAATVLEVRASDRAGLFSRICAALAAAGVSVRSAHVSTLAGQAIDVFYLVGQHGAELSEAEGAEACQRVRSAVGADVVDPSEGRPAAGR